MQEITGQVLSVSGRKTKTQRDIYEVAFSDGNKYTTFDSALAATANGLVGQFVSAHVEVSQNGQFTNYNLKAIAPQGQLAPLAMPAQPGTAVPIPVAAPNGAAAPAPVPVQVQQNTGGSGGWTPEATTRVSKLACLETAFSFVGQLFQGAGPESAAEAEELASGIAQRLYAAARSHEEGAVEPVVPATPQAVAEAVNAEAGTDAVQVGAATAGPAW